MRNVFGKPLGLVRGIMLETSRTFAAPAGGAERRVRLMSIANSIRAQIPPIHPEGYPFIGGFARWRA